MKNFIAGIVLLLSHPAYAQSVEKDYPLSFTVNVSNPSSLARQNVLVVISTEQLNHVKQFNDQAFIVLDGQREIPSQYNRKDKDKGIFFVLDELQASEVKPFTVRYHASASMPRKYTKRTQAELSYKTGGTWKNREYIGGEFKNTEFLRVPPEHKDHSWFMRYEGPGWESDKVGYRFYLDQRNATDVFGKVTTDMVLQGVGLDGFDSYHAMQPWGMDVMKVGKSLGIGSVGTLVNGAAIRVEKTDSVNCQIVENGAVYSCVVTNYYGWNVNEKKHDVQSRISIHAGTRITQQHLTISNDIENISTGIVKDKAAILLSSKGDARNFGYIATYGKQSLNEDQLGLAVLFHPGHLLELTADANSHIVKLKTEQRKVTYYFLSAWEKETNGIKDQKHFEDYLKMMANELANPVKVEIAVVDKQKH